jgi:hypothetical protein
MGQVEIEDQLVVLRIEMSAGDLRPLRLRRADAITTAAEKTECDQCDNRDRSQWHGSTCGTEDTPR